MFYVIKGEYIGPNQNELADFLRNCVHHDRVVIQTEPGITNSSREPLEEGWLGSTNDYSEHALGAYATLEEAREVARAKVAADAEDEGPITRGEPAVNEPFHDEFYDDSVVEVWPLWPLSVDWTDCREWWWESIDDWAERIAKDEATLDDIEAEVEQEAERGGLRLWDLSGLLREVDRRAYLVRRLLAAEAEAGEDA